MFPQPVTSCRGVPVDARARRLASGARVHVHHVAPHAAACAAAGMAAGMSVLPALLPLHFRP